MHLRNMVLSICILSTVAFSQSLVGTAYPDAYQVKIFANTGFADSYIDITNSGSFFAGPGFAGPTLAGYTGGPGLSAGTTASIGGSICANIYVFAADEQMMECCSCPVTPNESVELDTTTLVGTVLEPQLPTSTMVVALTATIPIAGSCAGSAYETALSGLASFPEDGVAFTAAGGATFTPPAGISAVLAPGLTAWGVTAHSNTSLTPAGYQLTETRFEPKPLLDAEATRLNLLCNFINANGSGPGICKGCTVGALAAAKQ